MPRKFIRKPVEAEGEQFLGWQNAQEMCEWLPGAFFVPQGYEHKLRSKSEFDRSNGHVLDNAEAFLIIRGNTLDEKLRVNRFQWVVLDQGMVKVFDGAVELEDQYQLVSGESNQGLRS